MDFSKIVRLLVKRAESKLNANEGLDFENWKNQSEKRQKFADSLQNKDQVLNDLKRYQSFNKNKSWNALAQKINNSKKPKYNFQNIYRAAAIGIMLLSVGSSLFYFLGSDTKNEILAETITPGEFNAILTIENNEAIYLRDTISKEIITQDVKLADVKNGHLEYLSSQTLEPVKMEIVVPEKSEFHFELSDGSEIWMNAGSKAIFYQPFKPGRRQVYVEGETYFKVRKDTARPFIVDILGHNKIEVLGTEFNIKAYPNDTFHSSVLVEGSIVWQTHNGETHLMKPGQLLNFTQTDETVEIENVDTYSFLAWKNGRFVFEEASMNEIMEQLSRWYGVNISYQNKAMKDMKFSVDVKRYDSLQTILNMLELTQKVKFEINESEIIIQEY